MATLTDEVRCVSVLHLREWYLAMRVRRGCNVYGVNAQSTFTYVNACAISFPRPHASAVVTLGAVAVCVKLAQLQVSVLLIGRHSAVTSQCGERGVTGVLLGSTCTGSAAPCTALQTSCYINWDEGYRWLANVVECMHGASDHLNICLTAACRPRM